MLSSLYIKRDFDNVVLSVVSAACWLWLQFIVFTSTSTLSKTSTCIYNSKCLSGFTGGDRGERVGRITYKPERLYEQALDHASDGREIMSFVG